MFINNQDTIQEHQFTGAKQVPSPNFNERPDSEISLIVIHGISLPAGHFGGDEIEQLFTNTLDTTQIGLEDLDGVNVSSHMLIQRTGTVLQFVPFHRRAWHAGESNFDGRPNCNDYAIGIELEGTDDLPYEDIQYRQLAIVCRLLMTYYGIREIRGHSHIAPGRKTDPGPLFDWPLLRREIASLR